MMMPKKTGISLLAFLLLAIMGCRKETGVPDYKGFPEDIGAILVTNCASSGCHDDASYVAEGRLSVESWESMFAGSRAGAAVIPFRTEQSYMLYFMNTDPVLGTAQLPTMPLNQPALSKEDYLKVRDWIEAGAPSADGTVKWADNPARKKIYAVNQGCDQVAVLDRDTRLVMRYVDVGALDGLVESPHSIRMSPDGRYWYLVFLFGNYIEKYDAETDAFVDRAFIGSGSWNTMDFSADGHYVVSPNLDGGTAVVVDLETMTLAATYSISGNPHGVRFAPQGGAIYFTQQEDDVLTKLVYADLMNPDGIETIDLEQNIPRSNPGRAMGPHELVFTPDGLKYAVTCSYQDEVRFYQASNDSLLGVVHVGSYPVEMAIGLNPARLYVTCMEDTTLYPGIALRRGSVNAIDWQAMQSTGALYPGYQPHGLAMDEEKGLLYVSNRNVNVNGPAPHHSSVCGGRNGYIVAIEAPSFTLLLGFKHELGSDPYAVGLRK
jgi:DNA-binding beta-propeller fold protein YncE